MACGRNCAGCVGCAGLGAYTEAPPLAFAGWRLRVGGNPPGGQYHGYLGAEHEWKGNSPWQFFSPGNYLRDGVYRSPGEVPAKANANGDHNTVVVPHTHRRAGYNVSPGSYSHLGLVAAEPIIGALPPFHPIATPKPIIFPFQWFEGPHPVKPIQTGSTQPVLQPPPAESPAPGPTVPMNCPPEGTYRDAAGNLVCDWHNPYSLYLPSAAQIQPAPVVSADTSPTPGAGQTPTSIPSDAVQGNAVSAAPSWFTDPNQELITGIPNWGIVAAAAAAFFLLKGRR